MGRSVHDGTQPRNRRHQYDNWQTKRIHGLAHGGVAVVIGAERAAWEAAIRTALCPTGAEVNAGRSNDYLTLR